MIDNTGGPAFPQALVSTEGGSGIVSSDEMQVGGMTLRDYFAAKAMQAVLGRKDITYGCEWANAALVTYQVADAMLKARKQ